MGPAATARPMFFLHWSPIKIVRDKAGNDTSSCPAIVINHSGPSGQHHSQGGGAASLHHQPIAGPKASPF